jgi:surfeit locus 1 family protein
MRTMDGKRKTTSRPSGEADLHARMRVSPRGIAGTILMLLVVGICTRLGFWQLDRLEQRRAFNAAAEAGMALPPLELNAASIKAIQSNPEAYIHRRAVARGTFDYGSELLLRGRAFEGRPGVHVAALLKLGDGSAAVLVNRGWMPSPDAATADPRPLRQYGPMEIVGRIQMLPAPGAESLRSDVQVGDTTIPTYRRFDRALLASASEAVLLPVYLEAEETAEGLVPVPAPILDEGSHFGYAVQWFSFAVIAVVGFLIVIMRGRRGTPQRSS